ncbi:MAG: 5-oxoprolinase subunit PxpB [Nitrospira sp.]
MHVQSLGDSAVTVELGETIDPAINARVIALAQAIARQRWDGVLDVVPTYRSVTVHVDPLVLDIEVFSEQLRGLALSLPHQIAANGRLRRIPVLYGGEWGPDLDALADYAQVSPHEVIRLHSAQIYRVYMLGFIPGFPYLGIVPLPLAMPRLATPRVLVPAGSVGIAGAQTGIYPTATPGGWRLIGRTPLSLYRPRHAEPFRLRAGDAVRFEPIEIEEFERLREGSNDYDA